MFVLLLVLIVPLFGLGFLHPLWWLAAALVLFAAVRHDRDRGGGGSEEYRDYKDRRDRQERWDRRYSRQNRAHWRREDRRDRERHW